MPFTSGFSGSPVFINRLDILVSGALISRLDKFLGIDCLPAAALEFGDQKRFSNRLSCGLKHRYRRCGSSLAVTSVAE